jgi:osmoprotectant transport system substrate-binding protein
MAEIYAQALEAKGFTVERKLNLGTREASQPAIESGQINLLPEYIGSELKFIGGTPTGDAAETHSALADALKAKDLAVLDPTPAQDQNGFVVRQETADEFSLTTISDLAKVADQLNWGLPPECETNELCSGALEKYGIDFGTLKVEKLAACDAPIAQALQTSAVDVAELCTTQPAIEQFNFVLLEDDLKTQPADNIAPIVSQDLLDAGGDELSQTLNDVSAKMTTDVLTKLGVMVAVDQKDVATVATQFLQDNGLV